MAFLIKSMVGNQLKSFGFGDSGEEKKESGETSDPAAAAGMTREEYEEYQRQLVEENEKDDNQIQMAADDIELPEDLQKMVVEDQDEEEEKGTIFGQIQNIPNMDMDAIKEKATATFTEMKQAAEEKCCVM
ncbi:hypothetical protein GDO78_007902 [Eleutherodactylus coqui]|uniref:Complexin 4 n=1 Tax=Eleutherodactylus coqui TaxID=57060 RepID=A0A8J6FKF9_ELECQ|nr:hypothetical protein GDO78_007902 [Eleutherodactylus coqui]